MNSKDALDYATRVRRVELTQTLAQGFKNTIQAGPFSGMSIELQNNWGDGDAAAKMLGCYEQELHECVETIVSNSPAIVVNVGCAEGFYTVGFAKRLPDSRVVGIDVNQTSLDVAAVNALNNQASNIELGSSCTPSELEYLLSEYDTGAVISDCEGYELELLDPALAPSLGHCFMLIECHDMIKPGITDTLYDRFGDTHVITKIKQSARNPYEFTWLEKLTDTDKWALVNEMRGETMHWLFMEPRK